jgi:hypothetical protein
MRLQRPNCSCYKALANRGGVVAAVAGYLSADASLSRLSRICAGVQAANPKTNAGFSFTAMQKKDNATGLIPISARTRATFAKSASAKNFLDKFA